MAVESGPTPGGASWPAEPRQLYGSGPAAGSAALHARLPGSRLQWLDRSAMAKNPPDGGTLDHSFVDDDRSRQALSARGRG